MDTFLKHMGAVVTGYNPLKIAQISLTTDTLRTVHRDKRKS